jgi:predicted outer membrane repeat protein
MSRYHCHQMPASSLMVRLQLHYVEARHVIYEFRCSSMSAGNTFINNQANNSGGALYLKCDSGCFFALNSSSGLLKESNSRNVDPYTTHL